MATRTSLGGIDMLEGGVHDRTERAGRFVWERGNTTFKSAVDAMLWTALCSAVGMTVTVIDGWRERRAGDGVGARDRQAASTQRQKRIGGFRDV